VSQSIAKFTDYFDALTAERRATPGDDLATVLANGRVNGEPLGERELLWYYIIVATAGHDTTSFALSGGMEQLLAHPDQLQALRNDPGLLVNATEEIIRWTSPVRSFFRWTQEDTVLGGQEIAAGDVVLTSYPSANRDDEVFVDPMSFDIRRPDADKLLSFGLGMHYCLGAQVARREVRTMLGKILERTSSIELAGEPEWSAAHFVSGVKHLPVRYTLR
jgi:cytochrome P450